MASIPWGVVLGTVAVAGGVLWLGSKAPEAQAVGPQPNGAPRPVPPPALLNQVRITTAQAPAVVVPPGAMYLRGEVSRVGPDAFDMTARVYEVLGGEPPMLTTGQLTPAVVVRNIPNNAYITLDQLPAVA